MIRIGFFFVFWVLCGVIILGVLVKFFFDVIFNFFLMIVIVFIVFLVVLFIGIIILLMCFERRMKELKMFCLWCCNIKLVLFNFGEL